MSSKMGLIAEWLKQALARSPANIGHTSNEGKVTNFLVLRTTQVPIEAGIAMTGATRQDVVRAAPGPIRRGRVIGTRPKCGNTTLRVFLRMQSLTKIVINTRIILGPLVSVLAQ
jgi:hypothetical protein